MADDWIKMRENLHEDPAILMIAKKLGTRPEHVVGYCHRFWSWVSRNCVPDFEGQVSPELRDTCPDSVPVNVPLDSLESVLALPGFLQMLIEVGWLKYEKRAESGFLVVPKFERHLSESAKTRALAAEKKRQQRSGKVSPKSRDKCPPKVGTSVPKKPGLEKRREEKSIKNPLIFPPRGEMDSRFAAFWESYPTGRKSKKPQARKKWEAAVKQIASRNGGDTVAAIAFLLDRCQAYAKSDQGRGKYVRGPAAWLNQAAYNDDPQNWQDRKAPTAVAQVLAKITAREEARKKDHEK